MPGDQGGKVYLSWYGARSDVFMDDDMSYYSIWRAIDPVKAVRALEDGAPSLDDLSKLDGSIGGGIIRSEKAIGGTFFWELLDTVDAYHMEGYGKPAATLFDSTGVCAEYSYFQIVAHTTDPTVFWKSDPDSGRSVDNLAPETPVFLASWYADGATRVRWRPNSEPDLEQYRLYRGTSAEFVPVIDNLVTAQADTGYVDSGMSPFSWYKLTAVDVHGNESAVATLSPQQITGQPDGGVPSAPTLAWPVPNPFNATTTIGFTLSRSDRVRIEVFDAVGRRVRTLVDEDRPMGRYEVRWDGTTDSGKDLASGVYFCRMLAGSFHETRCMTLIK